MNQQSSQQYDPLGIIPAVLRCRSILVNRFGQIVLVFAVLMAFVVAGVVLWPASYVSESQLFVRVGRENIGLDPTATTGQTIGMAESRENEITSILDILSSRVLLERLVDRLGTEMILEGAAAARAAVRNPADLSEDAALRREKAIRHLSETLESGRTKKSNVITLGYVAKSPELAQQILTAFVEEFQVVHIGANRTAQSFGFFEGQASLIRDQYNMALRELNEARSSIHAVSVDQRRATLQIQLGQVEMDILKTTADLESVTGTMQELQQTLSVLPQKSMTQKVTGFPDDAIGSTRKRLYDLQLQEQRLLAQYTTNHPAVEAVSRQIAAAQEILASRAEPAGQETNSDNPAFQQLHLKLLNDETVASGLNAKLSALNQQFTDITSRLQSLNVQEANIVELQQHADLYRGKHLAYSEKLEQARIDRALEAGLISNVSIVQPPSFVPKPVSPRKGISLILGCLLSATAAVCCAFLKEYQVAFANCSSSRPSILPQHLMPDPTLGAEVVASREDVAQSQQDVAAAVGGVQTLVAQAEG